MRALNRVRNMLKRDVTSSTTDSPLLTLAWIIFLTLAILSEGCASASKPQLGRTGVYESPMPIEDIPPCAFEDPYLPEPCKMEVTKGEWLVVRNPRPEPTKKHNWLWWFFLALVTI